MTGRINGRSVEFEPGQTILETARQTGHFIPTLCEMGEIKHAPGTCRVCVVQIRRAQDPAPYLVTSCNTPMEEGMDVFTRTQRVRDTQRLQVECYADHNQNCASCIRHGNCELQDVAQTSACSRHTSAIPISSEAGPWTLPPPPSSAEHQQMHPLSALHSRYAATSRERTC